MALLEDGILSVCLHIKSQCKIDVAASDCVVCVGFVNVAFFFRVFFLTQMGDEKDSWKVKTLDEILQEKKRRKEQEEKAEIKRMKNVSYPLVYKHF